ncbi:MAG: undecaprenyl-diphosphate phosphatase, partial [Treponema sp.]|nr:undecaprenyl-diphosphate phosphatase [Treponema sp.]
MNVINAVILGIVQGLTEFLPVSSSGHLVFLQKLFNIDEPGLFFDTMLHLGTLIAVFAVLWKDIWELLKKPFQRLTFFLILATIPAVIAALTLKDAIEHIFDSAQFLGICFLITTILLITAELLSGRAKNTGNLKNKDSMTWLYALIIGIMQACAIPPGISRSGATISGALFCKLDR